MLAQYSWSGEKRREKKIIWKREKEKREERRGRKGKRTEREKTQRGAGDTALEQVLAIQGH